MQVDAKYIQMNEVFKLEVARNRNMVLYAFQVCSPTKRQNCSKAIYSPGYCYKSSNGGRTWKADPETKNISMIPNKV